MRSHNWFLLEKNPVPVSAVLEGFPWFLRALEANAETVDRYDDHFIPNILH
jgi:hypothetical protein